MKSAPMMILWIALAAISGAVPPGWAQDQEKSPIGYVNILKMRSQANIYVNARQELQRLQDEKQNELRAALSYRFLTGAEAVEAASLELKAQRTDDDNKRLTALKDLNTTQRELTYNRLVNTGQPTEAQSAQLKELQQIRDQRQKELTDLQQQMQNELDQREQAWDGVVTDAVTSAFAQVAKEKELWVILSNHIRTLLPDPTQANTYIPEFQNVVLWGGLDITDRIVEVLNGMNIAPPPAAAAAPAPPAPAAPAAPTTPAPAPAPPGG